MGVAVFVEAIFNSADFFNGKTPIAVIIVRSEIITVIAVNIEPLAFGDCAGFSEVIKSSADACIAGICFIVVSEAIPCAVDLFPFVFNKFAGYCIVSCAIEFDKAGFIISASADDFSVGEFIFVAFCFNNFAPVENGVTYGTFGASGVTVFNAGCIAVCKCSFRMVMPFFNGIFKVCNGRIEFGFCINTFVRETCNMNILIFGIFNSTFFYLIAYGDLRSTSYCVPLIRSTVSAKSFVPAPCINRKSKKSCFAFCFTVNTGYGDFSSAGKFIKLIFIFESGKNGCVLKSPFGSGVEPEFEVNRFNTFNFIGVKKNVILAAGIKFAVCFYTNRNAGKRNFGSFVSTFDYDLFGKFGIVTLFIRNFKSDVVSSVRKSDCGCGNFACIEFGSNFVTVDINLCGFSIKSGEVGTVGGIFFCISSYSDGVIIKSSAVDCKAFLVLKNKRIGNDGHIAVINCIAVVKGDVIDVESYFFCTNSRGRRQELNESRCIVAIRRTNYVSVCIFIISGRYIFI